MHVKNEIASGVDVGIREKVDEGQLYRKINLRIVPFLFLCYLVAYVDRINIGFLKLQMQDALRFSDAVYGFGAGIFFLGYVLFEVPSNLLIGRLGARLTIGRVMLLWGLAAGAMSMVKTPMQFYVCRFMLGVFEAGFVPGVLYYLSCWFPKKKRGVALSIFLAGSPIGGMIGGPASGTIMKQMEGVLSWDGWQWAFVVEAVPAIILGILAFFLLTDKVADAKWLTRDERSRVIRDCEVERIENGPKSTANLADYLDKRIYLMTFAYFACICGTYTLAFWMPTMLKNVGVTNVEAIGWYVSIPFGCSAVAMYLLSKNSDRTGERRWHTALCMSVSAVAFAAIPFAPATLTAALILTTLAAIGLSSTLPLFWAIPSDYLAGSPSAAPLMALINSLGLLGGFFSPAAMGWIKQVTGTLVYGLYATAALLVVGALVLILGVPEDGRAA